MAVRDPVFATVLAVARWTFEFTGRSGGEYRLTAAHSADLFDPTMSREGVADSKGWISGSVDLTAQRLVTTSCSGAERVDLNGGPEWAS